MRIATRNALLYLALGLAAVAWLSSVMTHFRIAELERCLCLAR